MDFNLNYDIPDEGFWTPTYIGNTITVERLTKDFAEYKSRIKVAYACDDNRIYFDGYAEFHSSHYLLETLIGEGNVDGSTTLLQMEKYTKTPDNSKVSKKINNLKNGMLELFPNLFDFVTSRSKVDMKRFTPEFIQKLHKLVMNDLVELPGEYRTQWAGASQEQWVYLVPQKIEEKLVALCKYVCEEIGKEDHSASNQDILIGRIKIVATFLTEFLQIHPFTNGNGRVGRLLISWLIADISVVPVPLLVNQTKRDIYLECLRDARQTTPILPTNLARLVLDSVVRTMQMVCISIDI